MVVVSLTPAQAQRLLEAGMSQIGVQRPEGQDPRPLAQLREAVVKLESAMLTARDAGEKFPPPPGKKEAPGAQGQG